MFFGPIWKTRWPPWPLIGWDIFGFSSETADQNSTKLDRKQDLTVLYLVCVFRADRKTKMAALAGDWQIFSTSPLKPLNGIQRNLTGSKISTSSTKFVFFGPIGKTRWPPWSLIGWDIFDLSSETAERNSMKVKIEARSQHPLLSFVFRADLKNDMAAPVSHRLRFFHFSFETTERNSTKVDRNQDLNIFYQVCVFWPINKQKWPPWLILQKGSTLYSGARYVALWAACFHVASKDDINFIKIMSIYFTSYFIIDHHSVQKVYTTLFNVQGIVKLFLCRMLEIQWSFITYNFNIQLLPIWFIYWIEFIEWIIIFIDLWFISIFASSKEVYTLSLTEISNAHL